MGRDVGPRLAFRIGAAVAQDCVEVSVNPDTGRILATRPSIRRAAPSPECRSPEDGAQVVIVRPKTFEPLDPDASRSGDVRDFPVTLDESAIRARLVDTVTPAGGGESPSPRRRQHSRQRRTRTRRAGAVPTASVPQPAARRRAWSVPRRVRRRLDRSQPSGRTNRQDHNPRPLHHHRISGASQHMAGCSASRTSSPSTATRTPTSSSPPPSASWETGTEYCPRSSKPLES